MSHIIHISVANHVAKQTDKTVYVCGNTDYVVKFTFDDEWSGYTIKTCRFTYDGEHTDVAFTGTECAVPGIDGVNAFEVGVYTGELISTPVTISAKKSTLSADGLPEAPTDDVYNQILDLCDETMVTASEAKTIAKTASDNAEKAATKANTAASSANTAASNATSKAQAAETAASSATSAASSATSAASQATTAASSANTAASSAQAAATAANTAATRANNAADTVAAIDDTVVSTTAWSSKHIVDELCPAISETGNPVQCYPLKGYPLTATASWEPTQSGSGDPSPDNIRPITGRNSVQIQRCGENLVNIADFTLSVDNNTRTKKLNLPIDLPAGTYVINLNNSNASSNFGLQFQHREAGQSNKLLVDVAIFPTTVTINKSLTYFWCYIKNTAGNSTNISDVTLTAATTECTPYTGATTNLTLPETIYGGTVSNDGTGKKEWELLTITGSESGGGVATISNKFVYRTRITDSKIQSATLLSNRLKTIGNWGTMTDYSIEWQDTNYQNLVMYVPNMTSLDDYKTWFSNNETVVAYKLATPTTFTATGGAELTGLDGLNNVLTDADSVTVEGREDIKHTIQELQDALASATEG